uniref:histidine kinase n=1 Tax=Roseihalotalea indica TaxID=2867963 RepID=A0AA49GK10_9BACT|nr:response regulator [Tunicatimonas sp. TK19036]
MPIIKNYKGLYLVAAATILGLLSLSQWITHSIVTTQEQGGRLIDLARDQQFLGQKISQLSLQIKQNPLVDEYWNELMETEQVWSANYQGFTRGNSHWEWQPDDSPVIRDLLLQLQPQQKNIAKAVKSLFLEFDEDKFESAIEIIQQNEQEYQAGAEAIIVAFQTLNQENVDQLQSVAVTLGVFSVLILAFFFLTIVRPSIIHLDDQYQLLGQTVYEQDTLKEELNTLGEQLAHSMQIQKTVSDNLKETKTYAKQASHAKSQLLSTMSHEIRTPLNSILGITHLLLEDQPTPNQKTNLKTLQFSAQNLKKLVNNILEVSKIDADQIKTASEPFKLRELVQQVHQSLKHDADEKEISFALTIDSQVPDTVVGDSIRLTQILTNLISNAIKFTLEGYVQVTMKVLACEEGKVNVLFEVEDTGIGISEERMKTLFENPTPAEPNSPLSYSQSGLGLAITRKLLQLHESDLHIESRPNEGTICSFELIYQSVKSDAGFSGNINYNQGHLVGTRVLIAEDNKLNAVVLRQYMNKWGATFSIAENGEQALHLVEEDTYDIILMDVQMPVMDGLTASKIMRQQGITIPIIALTASKFNEIEEEFHEAGISDFTVKPFIPEELYITLVKHLLASQEKHSSDEATI